jgi:hypothetical protein
MAIHAPSIRISEQHGELIAAKTHQQISLAERRPHQFAIVVNAYHPLHARTDR